MKRSDLPSDGSDSRIVSRENHFRRDMEDRERRRRQWMIQQEREREHERRKKKKIEEYERKRALLLESMRHDKRSTQSGHARSRSASPSYRRTSDAVPSTSKATIASQKLDSPSDLTRLFKGSEGTKIDVSELRCIKVGIHRKVSSPVISDELQRKIVNPEDVIVKRRTDEGTKPLFEREEFKNSSIPSLEVLEHRRVITTESKEPEETKRKVKTTRRSRSASHTESRRIRNISRSRCDTDSSSVRQESSRHNIDRSESHRYSRRDDDRNRSSERSRDRRDDRYRRHSSRDRRSPRRSSNRDISRDRRERRSRSDDRETRRSDRDTRHRDSSGYRRSRRDSSYDETRGRSSRDRSRERRMLPPQLYQNVPMPVFYDAFSRPIMVSPMMPMRGPMPIRGPIPMPRMRMPPMMGPIRPLPFSPRFIHPNARVIRHPNPGFGAMYWNGDNSKDNEENKR